MHIVSSLKNISNEWINLLLMLILSKSQDYRDREIGLVNNIRNVASEIRKDLEPFSMDHTSIKWTNNQAFLKDSGSRNITSPPFLIGYGTSGDPSPPY